MSKLHSLNPDGTVRLIDEGPSRARHTPYPRGGPIVTVSAYELARRMQYRYVDENREDVNGRKRVAR